MRMGLRIEYIQIIQHTTYSLIFAKASANALLIGCSASFCCFFIYACTSRLDTPPPSFFRRSWNLERRSLCPQEQTNILSSPFPIISIRLWQIGHLAFVVRDTVSRYPQARSWHTRSFAFFPLTASNRFPQFGHFLFVMFSWRKVPSSLRISCSSSFV